MREWQQKFDSGDTSRYERIKSDLPLLSHAAFAAAPANAHPEVSARARHVTRASGGAGAVRELCDLLLQAQGRYAALLAPYLTTADDPA